jgi:CSLREA domain-containing protein
LTSLREAIAAANGLPGADKIDFSPALFESGPGTILLTRGQLEVTDSLTLTGRGAEVLTIDASGNDPTPDVNNGDGSRVMSIVGSSQGEASFQIVGVTLTGGDAESAGGALLATNVGSFSLRDSAVIGNHARGAGGGISVSSSPNSTGDLRVEGSRLSNNTTFASNGQGGGGHLVHAGAGNIKFIGNLVENNVSQIGGDGGGVFVSHLGSGQVDFRTNEIYNNDASRGDNWVHNGGAGGASIRTRGSSFAEVTGNIFSPKSKNSSFGNRSVLALLGNGKISRNRARGEGAAGTRPDFVEIYALADGLQAILIEDNIAETDPQSSDTNAYFTITGDTHAGGRMTIARNNFGTIYALGSGEIDVLENVVVDNRATGIRAVSELGGTIYLARNIVERNRSTYKAGGIEISASGGGSVVVEDMAIQYNLAFGGTVAGISAESGRGGAVILRNLTIANNTSESTNSYLSAGGIYINATGGRVLVEQSTISGNTTSGEGGGVWVTNTANGSVTIRNSTITANASSGLGGGLYLGNGTVVVEDSVIAANSASSATYRDVFIYPSRGVPPSMSLSHSLIGTAWKYDFAEAPLGSPDADGNLIGGAVYGAIDPLLGPLADNGGPVLPGGAKLLTHAPLAGSPAIDAGDPTALPGEGGVPEFDQRGAPFSRRVGAAVDLGAVEHGRTSFVVDTLADEADGDYSAGDLSLREAVLLANAQPGRDEITFSIDLPLPSGIGAIGLGPMGEIVVTDELDIHGPGVKLGVKANNSRVFRIDNGRRDVASRVTISGLFLEGLSRTGGGGAVYSAEPLELSQVRITGASLDAIDSRGGVILAEAGLKVTGLTVPGAFASGDGGAIWATGGVEINDSNISHATSHGNGGAIAVVGNLTIRNSTLAENRAGLTGGAIYVSSESPQASAEVRVESCFVSDNSSYIGSGASWDEWTTFVSLNSTWYLNRFTTPPSGAKELGQGSTLFGEGPLVLAHSTVCFNEGRRKNGAVNGKIIYLTHSIVGDSTPGSPDLTLLPGGVIAADYSLVSNGTGSGLQAGAPNTRNSLIGGAGSLRIDAGFINKNGMLLPISPAVNAGDPNLRPGDHGLPEFDVRGGVFARFVGGRIDLGAFEFQPEVGTYSADFAADALVDGADLLAWQRGLGAASGGARADGDATGDGDVDASDLAVWRSQWSKRLPVVQESFAASVSELSGAQAAGLALATAPQAATLDAAAADRALVRWTPSRRARWMRG